MKNFDVIIAGTGPAGSQAAKRLTELGYTVLIFDKVESLETNNFSSAGTPLETISKFAIPPEVVASRWNNVAVRVNDDVFTWHDQNILGGVLDFSRLRKYLIDTAIKTGRCTLLLGVTWEQLSRKYNAKIFIDATGPARAFIKKKITKKISYITATGIEYLLEAEDAIKQIPSNSLFFFLGSDWIPYGYSWIFPMEKGKYKFGVGGYNLKREKSLEHYLNILMRTKLQNIKYKILDKHGGTLIATSDHSDLFYSDNVIAIGDAVSSVNWLGGEGIRHALFSADYAAETIDDYLKGKIADLKPYEQKMRRYFGNKWKFSYYISRFIYTLAGNFGLKLIFTILERLNGRDLIRTVFGYDFRLLFKAIINKKH